MLRPAVPPPTDAAPPSTKEPAARADSGHAAAEAEFPANGSTADPPAEAKPGQEAGADSPAAAKLAATGTAPGQETKAGETPGKESKSGETPANESKIAETSGEETKASKTPDKDAKAGAAPPKESKAGELPGQGAEPGKTAGEQSKPGETPGSEAKAGAETDAEPKSGDESQTTTDDGTASAGGTRRRRPRLPSLRPPGAPPDPWTAFAETAERGPGRIRRAARAVGRGLVHEYALVVYGSLLLAVLVTWPALRYPLHTFPHDIWDPSREAWQVSWSGHILITDPARLWQSNAYFPEAYSFAFGNHLLGYAPAGMLGKGPLVAVLRYNILFVLAHALLTIGGYALIRQLGAGRTGAIVGAAAFAYAPWRLAQEGHLDIISAGGIPLALAMLARGHGWSMRYGFRPDRRRAPWAAAGWLVAIWQLGLGFSLGLPFAYVLGVIIVIVAVAVLVRRLRRRSPRPVLGWRLLLTDALGMLIFAGVGAVIALPYLRSPDTGPAAIEIRFFSPPLRSLLIGPAESRIWGAPHAVARESLGWPAEMTLLPGFVLYALALVGLVFSVWRIWQRLLLLTAVMVGVIFTLGSTFFQGRWTYLPLFGHLPASFGVRIPGRLMFWVTLLLAILAAGAVAEFVRRAEQLAAHRMPPRPGPWLRLATFVPLLLVLVESWSAIAHPVVPKQPAAMRTVTGPMLVLPTAALTDQTVMLWSTTRFEQMANGSGGFAPQRQSDLRRSVTTFPDAASIQYLRTLGVTTVLLLRSQVAGTPWERAGDVPVDTLQIQREDLDNDSVIFRLN
ncbi:hypothetical protein [Actinoplanes sp. NPDC026623]|uniref:hypothetical protein n=1 Tax=Actinoplanes sp. NPDC026623 TaxID=3155610 RepID=UPI0033F80D3D